MRYSDHLLGSGAAILKNACQLGLEGIVSKDSASLYIQNRGKTWLKTKCIKRQEFVIGGFTPPQKSRSFFVSLLMGTYNQDKELVYNGRVGTGFTESTLKTIYALLLKNKSKQMPFNTTPPASKTACWVKPILIAEIAFTEWTQEGRLRHPSFKGLRKDKFAKDIIPEQEMPIQTITPNFKSPTTTYKLTHPDKILYSEDKITKRNLADYYEYIAPWILPYIINHPLTLVRCPNGYQACFYQKHINDISSSPSLYGITIKEKNSHEQCIYIKDKKGLMLLPQLGTLEIHPWGSRIENIGHPDMITFDLDPAPGVPWKKVVKAAFEVKKHLEAYHLKNFVKTTGGKGLHIVIPIKPEFNWDEIKNFTHVFVDFMVLQNPKNYISKMTKNERKGKIFLDYLRNQRGSTAVAPYSTRARKHAPIATPIAWDELTDHFKDTYYTIHTLPLRLKKMKKDPWEDFFKISQSLNLDFRSALNFSHGPLADH